MAARPIYAELADDLIRQINSGERPVGSLLPTEMEIAAERQVSRATVRSALDRLVSLGLVTRQKGVGTRVSSPKASAYGASTGTIEELSHFGTATERRFFGAKEVVIDEVLANRIGARPGSRWMRLQTVRVEPHGGKPPICWTDNYIDRPYAALVDELPSHRGLIADLVAVRWGLITDEVVQTIRPCILTEKVAWTLEAEPRSTALEIIRRYRSAGTMIYATVSQHPSDRFEYKMTLKRQNA